jgi:predicted DNA-binding transcriptional regulator AlpA
MRRYKRRLRPFTSGQYRDPTKADRETVRLYGKTRREYGLTNKDLCERLGVSPDRPSKWRHWVYGTYWGQKRRIPPGIYERLLEIRKTLMETNAPRFMKRPEAAKLMGVSIMTIGRWSQAGRFPKPVKIGTSYFYERDEIEQFIQAKKAE